MSAAEIAAFEMVILRLEAVAAVYEAKYNITPDPTTLPEAVEARVKREKVEGYRKMEEQHMITVTYLYGSVHEGTCLLPTNSGGYSSHAGSTDRTRQHSAKHLRL